MPPGPSKTATELYMQGLLSPTSGLSPEVGLLCLIDGQWQPQNKNFLECML